MKRFGFCFTYSTILFACCSCTTIRNIEELYEDINRAEQQQNPQAILEACKRAKKTVEEGREDIQTIRQECHKRQEHEERFNSVSVEGEFSKLSAEAVVTGEISLAAASERLEQACNNYQRAKQACEGVGVPMPTEFDDLSGSCCEIAES